MTTHLKNAERAHAAPHPFCPAPTGGEVRSPAMSADARAAHCESQKQRYRERRARGLCRSCPGPAEPGRPDCPACRERNNASRRKANRPAPAATPLGLCVSCHTAKRSPGMLICPACTPANTQP